MKAMVVRDGRLHWSEVSEPRMGPEEILVKVYSSGVNRADVLQRQGKYPPPAGAPEWPGLEAAGVVLEIGQKAKDNGLFKKGDRVCALLPGGGYAERIAIRHELLMPVPECLSMDEASSLPEALATSYLNLIMEAGLKEGESVLIYAGASGLGVAAVQLAKMFGARVLAVVGSDEKAEMVSSLGADIVINRKKASVGSIMDDCLSEGRPVDVAMDCVGGDELGPNLNKLALDGRWILISTLGGEYTEIHLRTLLTRRLRLVGSTLRSRSFEAKARIIRDLSEKILPQLESGIIRPVVYRSLPIEKAGEAHMILEKNENIGKVVLVVNKENDS